MFDVICVGQAVVDCITKGREEEPYKENVYRAKTISLHTGGDAMNEAIALSHMGVQVSVVCGLGEDVAGKLILNELKQNGIHTDLVTIGKNVTPIANIQVAEDGSRYSINSESTKLFGYRLPSVIPNTKILSLASLFRPPLVEKEVVLHIVKEAKEKGSIIVVDTKLPLAEEINLDSYKEILALVDYIFPNEKEAEYYTKKTVYQDMADVLHGYGIPHVILKLGKEGCYISSKEIQKHLPALPIEHIEDSTGAGDHFVAGFLAHLLQGESFEACAQNGLLEASFCLQRTGGSV